MNRSAKGKGKFKIRKVEEIKVQQVEKEEVYLRKRNTLLIVIAYFNFADF